MAQALQQFEHRAGSRRCAIGDGQCSGGRVSLGIGRGVHERAGQRVVKVVGGVGLPKNGAFLTNSLTACQWMRSTTPSVMAG